MKPAQPTPPPLLAAGRGIALGMPTAGYSPCLGGWRLRCCITRLTQLVLMALLVVLSTAHGRAQDSASSAAEPSVTPPVADVPAADSPQASLADEQRQLGEQFAKLEDLLLRLAELSAGDDPRRAALLRRAVGQSKDRLLGVQFARIAQLLGEEQVGQATSAQQSLTAELRQLLDLLLSENRTEALRAEQAALAALARKLDGLIRDQQGLLSKTADPPAAASPPNGATPLANDQAELARRAGKLSGEMQSLEGQAGPSDETPSETAPPEATDKPPAKEPPSSPEGPAPSEPTAPDQPSAESPAAPSEGSEQPASPEQPPPNDSEAPSAAGPSEISRPVAASREHVRTAQRRMQSAQQKLEQAKRQQATAEQEEALRELREAKAELEEILRQVREEELQQTLEQLETRFRQMLDLQVAIRSETERMDSVPTEKRDRSQQLEAGRLSRRETLLVTEADKVLLLLREDGTSLALSEAMRQVRADAATIAGNLEQGSVGSLTQQLQHDVITTLEELIEAVKEAQEEHRQPPSPQGPPGGETQEQALVNRLAELRMVRQMQLRINRRTGDLQRLLGEGGTPSPAIADALGELAQRQARLTEVTQEMARQQEQK